jgi:beta-lactamase class D
MKTNLLSLVFLAAAITVVGQSNSYKESWASIFNKHNIVGTFVLYEMNTGQLQIYNEKRSKQAFLPASTFKILNSLISLETGVINSVNDTIKWDGKEWWFDSWNQDQTMKNAISISCVWFYQELARRIGNERMQDWITRVGYGNEKMGSQVDNFWLEGDLRISAEEQIKFLERLINNELPFTNKNQEIVRNIIITDSTENYIMHSKTGWAMRAKNQVGWFVGYVEKKNGKWIFALNIDIGNKSDAKLRKKISYEILRTEGIIN